MASKQTLTQETDAQLEFYNEMVEFVILVKNCSNIYCQYKTAFDSGLVLISKWKAEAFLYLYFFEFQKIIDKILLYTGADNTSFHQQTMIGNMIITYVDIDKLNNHFAFHMESRNQEWKNAKNHSIIGSDDTFDDLIKGHKYLYKIIYSNYSTMNFLNPQTNECVSGPIEVKPEVKAKKRKK